MSSKPEQVTDYTASRQKAKTPGAKNLLGGLSGQVKNSRALARKLESGTDGRKMELGVRNIGTGDKVSSRQTPLRVVSNKDTTGENYTIKGDQMFNLDTSQMLGTDAAESHRSHKSQKSQRSQKSQLSSRRNNRRRSSKNVFGLAQLVPPQDNKPEVTNQQKGKFSILVMKPKKVLVREASPASSSNLIGARYDGPTNLSIVRPEGAAPGEGQPGSSRRTITNKASSRKPTNRKSSMQVSSLQTKRGSSTQNVFQKRKLTNKRLKSINKDVSNTMNSNPDLTSAHYQTKTDFANNFLSNKLSKPEDFPNENLQARNTSLLPPMRDSQVNLSQQHISVSQLQPETQHNRTSSQLSMHQISQHKSTESKRSMAAQLAELKARKAGGNLTDEEKFKQQFGEDAVDEEGMALYLETMKIFEGRDFKQERTRIREQADQLQQRNQVGQLARKGNYVLEQVRGLVDQSMMESLAADPTKVQMTLLNDYLNSYSEKLARGSSDDASKIKIDKQDFYQIVKDVNADAYNPYLQANTLKEKMRDLEQETAALGKLRKNNSLVEKKAQEKEEKEFVRELKKVLFDSMPNPAEMSRLYKKGLSINKFKNFKSVMEDLHGRTANHQRSNSHASCNRISCQKKASTFYMGTGFSQQHTMLEESNDYPIQSPPQLQSPAAIQYPKIGSMKLNKSGRVSHRSLPKSGLSPLRLSNRRQVQQPQTPIEPSIEDQAANIENYYYPTAQGGGAPLQTVYSDRRSKNLLGNNQGGAENQFHSLSIQRSSQLSSTMTKESSPGEALQKRFVNQGYLMKARMQNQLQEQVTGVKPALRFDGKPKKMHSISSNLMSISQNETPKPRQGRKQRVDTSPNQLYTQQTVRTTNQSLYSEVETQAKTLSTISKIEDVGKIWIQNDRQRRQNKSLKRKGEKQITTYRRQLNKLSKVVDETILQIRKNVQKDKVDRVRLANIKQSQLLEQTMGTENHIPIVSTLKESNASMAEVRELLRINPTIDQNNDMVDAIIDAGIE